MLTKRILLSVDTDLKTTHGFGTVRFSSSRRRPAPWICVSAHNSDIPRKLHLLMCGHQSIWNLKTPTSLISVTGGALSLKMSDKQKMIFQRGLISAASTTNAWIMTGGTDTGVMQMVGKTLQESNLDVPCIGVVPWGIVADREKLARADNGAVHNYVGATFHSDDPCKTRVALDPNHTHFVFADSGNSGSDAFGDEIELRSQLEDCVCKSSKTRMETRANCVEAMTPMVLVVVGGGMGTLRTIVHTLQNERPVVVFGDGGGAGAHIREFHNKYNQIARERIFAMWNVASEYVDLLDEIHRLGTVTKGINQNTLLTFFNTSDDISAGNDFDQRILSALLSDCQDTIDAINLAVFWRNPSIIKMQLCNSNMYEPHRLAHAFEHALMCQNAAVVRVLIEHNARPTFITYANLWNTPDEGVHRPRRISTPGLLQKTLSTWHPFIPRHALVKISGVGYEHHIEARITTSKDQPICTTWCDLVVWAVVSGQCEMAKGLWTKTREPLRSALNAIKLALLNAQCESSQIRARKWEEDARQYEMWAEGILSNMEVEHAMELLMTVEVRNSTHMWPRSIMDEATRTDDASIRRFISHPHCQHLLDNLFCGHFPESIASIHQRSSVTWVLLQIILLPFANIVGIDCTPALFGNRHRVTSFEDTTESTETDNDYNNEWFQTISPTSTTKTHPKLPYLSRLGFFCIPKVKFVTHNCMKCLYALILSLMLCKLSFITETYQYLVWIWTCTLLFEECRQLSLQGYIVYFTFWNVCDLLTYLGISSVAIARLFIVPYTQPWWSTPVYALVILLVYVRFIESLGAWRSVGVLRIILTKMIRDVITWFTIILFFTTGTGLAFIVLVPATNHNSNMLTSPFWSVFWGLLGSMDYDNEITYGKERILTTMISILMWTYSFIATVIFVNLLIAQMSSTYDRVKVEADEFWQFERMTLIREYKDNRESLPPPFNIVLYLVLFGKIVSRRLRRVYHNTTTNSRGFRQSCDVRRVETIFSKSTEARAKYVTVCDSQKNDTFTHQMELLKHGQRIIEADLRLQFETITGRFDALE